MTEDWERVARAPLDVLTVTESLRGQYHFLTDAAPRLPLPDGFRYEQKYVDGAELPEQRILDERFSQSFLLAAGNCRLVVGDEAEKLIEMIQPRSGGLHGTIANSGEATGDVVIVETREDLERVEEGDIIVTVMTRPGWTDVLRNAGGIVTEAGARLSHAAILARELDIPCVMHVEGAMQILQEGETVTVDANEGEIRKGE